MSQKQESQADPTQGLSVRELKAALRERGVDFVQCREKSELRDLLREVLEKEQAEKNQEEEEEELLPDGSFAMRRADCRLCWVEFVTDGDALCHWDDGTDAIIPAEDLDLVEAETLPGPPFYTGSFEEARVNAFETGKLLVAVVQEKEGVRLGASKAEGVLSLVLASEEASLLLGENAVVWRGAASSLREQHQMQLVPKGPPSLAMVLPLAADAMRVLSHGAGGSREEVVEGFVAALEALEAHRSQTEARRVSEAALLREEQDAELAESLEADRRRSAAAQAEEERKSADVKEEAVEDREAQQRQEQLAAEAERLAKRRKVLSEEFLEKPPVPTGSGAARLVLRLPSGERVQRSFLAEDTLACVQRWAECCTLLPEAAGRSLHIPEHFELATAFPQRCFGPSDAESTLAELGLAPSAALLLIDKTT